MDSRTIDVVTGWETVTAPTGYEGLHRLADTEFSGAVSAGTAWAFLLSGRVVGVFEGDIGDFEDADLTAYRAADPGLPLLFSMQERGGETQASYYTNETPLPDVDRTLSNGGFTGYIELSENVLSGDYYVVYHGGESMSVAFVGNSGRLVTGDDAFETAADEVGIYEVVDVDIELVDIPDPVGDGAEDGDEADVDGPDADDEGSADATDTVETREVPEPDDVTGLDAGDADEVGAESGAEESAATDPDPDTPQRPATGTTGAGNATQESGTDPEPEPDTRVETRTGRTGTDAEPEGPREASSRDDGTGGDPSAAGAAGATEPAGSEGDGSGPADPEPEASEPSNDGDVRRRTDGVPAGESGAEPDASGDPDGTIADEKRWQEARTIPSLDPDGSTEAETDNDADRESRERTARAQRRRKQQRSDRTNGETDGDEQLQRRLSRARDRVESLEAERDELRVEREDLVEERDSLRSERTELTDRIESLEAERDELRAEVERLESELDAAGGSPSRSESISTDRALSGTNLFVRYDTKGQAALKHAHAGNASREEVRDNLRLEHHTAFETEGLVVDNRPYEEFLHDTTEYAFAQWVVSDLLYEIERTGTRSELAGVFDAIPDVDRVELYGEASVETADGVEQRAFDVICRDRMGDPLFVADINPSRSPTTEAMVGSLVENTGTVAAEEESLAAGLYVTESFYEPGALETVAERTSGGLLSRSKKRSFVKLSRKQGYHLCLVEARDGEFHLNVPEL